MVSEMAVLPGRDDMMVSAHHDNQETERGIQSPKTQCWLPSSSNLLYPYCQDYLLMYESTMKCLAQGPQDLTGNALLTDSSGVGEHGSVVECLLCSFEDLAFREDK